MLSKNNKDESKYLKELAKNSPLWRIKYRPSTLNALKPYRRDIVEQLKGYVKAQNIPHLMFVGPKGAGKTVLAEVLSREILQEEFDMNFKVLFANDPIGKEERRESRKQAYISTSRLGSSAGIQKRYRPFIQIRVRPFVSTKKFGESPFKILVIKHFHDLDVEQQAFRRIMEQYSNNCRMILITDKISGIIDPIVSRCQLIMVPYIEDHLFNRFIKEVCVKEKVSIKLNELNYLRYITKSNIGDALDLIQLTNLRDGKVNLTNLSEVESQLNERMVAGLFSATLNGNLKGIRRELRKIFKTKKLSKNEIFTRLTREVLRTPLQRSVKAQYLSLIADMDYESLDSNNDEIQINKLLSQMAIIGSEIEN